MPFDQPGFSVGCFEAAEDFSDAKHQWTPVWLGVGDGASAVRGGTAILKPGAGTDGGSGTGGGTGGSGGSGTPAPPTELQKDSFSVTDGDFAEGSAYGFDINGEAVSVTAAAGQTASDVLDALGDAAKAKVSSIDAVVSQGSGKTTLQVSATTPAAITYANVVGLTRTEDQAAPDVDAGTGTGGGAGAGGGTGSGTGDSAGQIKGAPLGILQNTPIKGEACNVMVQGISYVRAGGDWEAGDTLGAGDDGVVVKATSGAALGLAVESAKEGDLTSILLLPRSAA